MQAIQEKRRALQSKLESLQSQNTQQLAQAIYYKQQQVRRQLQRQRQLQLQLVKPELQRQAEAKANLQLRKQRLQKRRRELQDQQRKINCYQELRQQFIRPKPPTPKPPKEALELKQEIQTILDTTESALLKIDKDREQLQKRRLQLEQNQRRIYLRKAQFYERRQKGEDFRPADSQELIQKYKKPKGKQFILDNIQLIQNDIKSDLQKMPRPRMATLKTNSIDQLKNELKKELAACDQELVQVAREFVLKAVDQTVQYLQEMKSRFNSMQRLRVDIHKKHEKFMQKQLGKVAQYAIQKIYKQMMILQTQRSFKEIAQEIHQLDNIAFDLFFNNFVYRTNESSVDRLIQMTKELQQQPIHLSFSKVNSKDVMLRKLKNQGLVQSLQQFVDMQTTDLIDDLDILTREDQFYNQISPKSKILDLYMDEPKKIFSVNQKLILAFRSFFVAVSELNHKSLTVYPKFIAPQSQLNLTVDFYGNSYIALAGQSVTFGQQPLIQDGWGQSFSESIGRRSNNQQKITTVAVFPNLDVLGNCHSFLLGFQDGVIMRYNSNRQFQSGKNPAHDKIKILSPKNQFYFQPPLPGQIKNLIEVEERRFQRQDSYSRHVFRQFFQEHKASVAQLCVKDVDQFISLDIQGWICIWEICKQLFQKDAGYFRPKFKVRLNFNPLIFKAAQNSKVKQSYPGDDRRSPQAYFQYLFEGNRKNDLIYHNFKKKQAYFITGKHPENEAKNIQFIKYEGRQVKSGLLQLFMRKKEIATCINAKIFQNYLFVMAAQPHVIRQDIITIKIASYDLKRRYLRKISYSYDMVTYDGQIQFYIDSKLIEQYPVLLVLNYNRILVFSVLTGQLLRSFSGQPGASQVLMSSFGIIDNRIVGLDINCRKLIQVQLQNSNEESSKRQFVQNLMKLIKG